MFIIHIFFKNYLIFLIIINNLNVACEVLTHILLLLHNIHKHLTVKIFYKSENVYDLFKKLLVNNNCSVMKVNYVLTINYNF